MRKIITSSVLILLFSLFSGSVFAGKIEACENIKHDPAYKGLYGLCNAFWNANEKAQGKILAKFDKKAGPDGPGMPGLDDPVPEPEPKPEPEPIECPCWTTDELTEATMGVEGAFCTTSAVSDEAVYIDNVPLFSAMQFDSETGMCEFLTATVGRVELAPTAEIEACRLGIQVLQESTHEDGSYVFEPCFEF